MDAGWGHRVNCQQLAKIADRVDKEVLVAFCGPV